MKNARFYLSIFSLSAALVACGGSGSSVISGTGVRCKEDGSAYNPIPTDISAQKVSMKSGDKQLPQGQYVFAGAEIYYYDSLTKTQIHLQEDANFKASTVCMRNVPAETKETLIEVPIASSLSVKGNATDFDVRTLRFVIGKDPIVLKSKELDKKEKEKFKSAEEVFLEKGSRMEFYKTSDTTYETRTSVTEKGIRRDLIVRYTFKK